ncbi:hypothetical protein HZR84_02695 [Hyphobacterium sp. CCMP332]|nr:hypothetical protein HZR84_02695 [Hyphobacterium sp. CCMP332]
MMDKQKIIQKFLPHVIAVIVMILLPLFYASPVLEGKVLYQNDILQGGGGSSELSEYRENTGEEALWTGTMFSGMPTFQMAIEHANNVGFHINRALRRLIKGPISIVFICMLGAYILFIAMGVNPYLSLICAIGFGFSTFNLVSLEAGHNSKINALAYFPGVLGGVILCYNGRLWLGAALAALFLNLHLVSNHFQITYYLIFALLFYFGFKLYEVIRQKSYKQFINATLLLIIAAILAAVPNTSRLWTTYEYANETIRGGKSELTKPEADARSTGLDKDYAMSWSYGVMETFTVVIPYFKGGASNETLDRKSNLAKTPGFPAQALKQVPTYWGDQPFTSGPVYLGAIFCFLFVLAMLLLKGPIKWWLAAYSFFALLLSWGSNFSALNDFLFYNLPLYNKFRTPSMFLGVLQITFPFASALVLQKVLDEKNSGQDLVKKLLLAFAITGGVVFVFGILLSGGYSYEGQIDPRLQAQGWPMEALKDDRASLLRGDAIRSLILISLAAGLIYLYMKDKIKELALIALLGILMLGDLWLVDKRYLNKENFQSERKFENLKVPTTADLQIMEDDDLSFRVFNLTRSPFNDGVTSYHHKSIGGYHAGKLFRYQELIEKHLSKNNMNVLNMLNTKYFIVADKNTNQPQVRRNPAALGNAWFVNNIKWASNADEEMNSLSNFDPANEVVIDERFTPYFDSRSISRENSDKIDLVEYNPNVMVYNAKVNSENAFAVFSEIYYKASDNDWKVTIDGEKVDHIRVNYLLRGMLIPKGEHEIIFTFQPKSWRVGNQISIFSSIALVIFIAGAVFMHLRKSTKINKENGEA